MLSPKELAIKHSMSCFFNSFLRDTSAEFDFEKKCFNVALESSTLHIPVEKYSEVGVHQFKDEMQISVAKGERPIGFLEAADLICYEYGEGQSNLFSRLNNSIHNMALSIDLRKKAIESLYAGEIDFMSAEQGLLIGHSFHPTPKSRDEFSDDDLIKYGPEFGAGFKLTWLLVKPIILFEGRSSTFAQTNWQKAIYKKDIPQGFVPLPVHPWQKKVLLNDPTIQQYMAGGLIVDGGETPETWYATSSMRSLYSPKFKYMLKFSMSVKMTNSIRHLQEKEVGRGMLVQDAFHTPSGLEFSKRFPQFKVLHEPAYVAIKSPKGDILPQTVALVRENPFVGDEKPSVAVLATLTQNNPLGGKNLIATCLKGMSGHKWFEAFLDHSVIPLLVAQADYGIMLGAHQQNLLIKLQNGMPVGSYFRDCQGTAFSALGETLMAKAMPDPSKFETLPADASTVLFTYYLIINSVLNTIAAVADASNATEKDLILVFQDKLKDLRTNVKDTFVIDHLLDASELEQKGNFRCSIKSINENTIENPLAIYNTFPNPFFLESSV